MVVFIIFVVLLIGISLYILLSKPNFEDNYNIDRSEHRKLSYSNSKNSYARARNVYKTLRDAGIGPCFLEDNDGNE